MWKFELYVSAIIPTCNAACILDKVFIQASSLACEFCVEVSLLHSLPTTVCETADSVVCQVTILPSTVCEVKVCLLFLILCYWVCVIVNLLYFLSTIVCRMADSIVWKVTMFPSNNSLITNGHLLFVMGALILQRAQKCEVRQVTKDVVKSEV